MGLFSRTTLLDRRTASRLRAHRIAFFSLLLAFVSLLYAPAASAQSATVVPGVVPVGSQSAVVSVLVRMSASGTAASVQAQAQGASVSDFALAAGTACASGTPYNVGDTCAANVTFSPKFPGLRAGAVQVLDGSGNLLGTGFVSGIGKGGLGVLNSGLIQTAAGSSAYLYRGDGMPAQQAQIFLPLDTVVDNAGNYYISDSGNYRIRRVTASTGLISTVAGNGVQGYSGDGGLATRASISGPSGLALDGAGNLFFVDSSNHCVRRVDAVSGIVTTVAGMPQKSGYSGDNGPATAATLSSPNGLAIDASGNLYIGDTGNNAVREVLASNSAIKTLAGTGVATYNGDNKSATSAALNSPWGLAVGLDGSVYIADLNNHRIRKVSLSGIITTVAGNGAEGFSGDKAAANSAQLNAPAGIAVDPANNLYISDSGNYRVRKVYAKTGIITSLAGVGDTSSKGDGGLALDASLYTPYGLHLDQYGNIYIAEFFLNHIRLINAMQVQLKFPTMKVGKLSDPQSEGFENDGNGDLKVVTPGLNNAALDAATTTCTAGSTLTSSSTCVFGVEFAPKQVGDQVQGLVTANSDAANSPALINLVGQVLNVEPTSVTVVSSKNPSMVGDAVNFTATVTSADTSRVGTITFTADGNNMCLNVPINTNGIAVCTISTLALGKHDIVANYSGDANNAAAISPDLFQTVLQNVTLVLGASPTTATVGQNVTLTLKASATSGTPTGSITFYDGATILTTVNLDGSGQAQFATITLAPGAHSLVAKYGGDAVDAPGTSNTVSVQIQRGPTTTTLATSNASVPVGTAVTFTASVSSTIGLTPGGTVTFKDGAATIGTATLASGTAILTTSTLSPGTHSIVASYGGDTNDDVSSSSALTETVQQLGTTTTLTSDANPANAGAPIHFTAKVAIVAGATAYGAITGTVTFVDGTTNLGTVAVDASGNAVLTLSNLAVGGHALVATYGGNTNYAASSSAPLSQTVQQTTTTTTLSSSNLNSLAGKPVTFTSTVTSTTGGIPTGPVSFREGTTVLGQGTVNAQGVAVFTTSTLAVGTHNIVAVYVGDNNYATSTSAPIAQVVSLAAPGLTLSGPSAPVDAGITATFSAALTTSGGVAPTGALTLKEGSVVIGTQNVTNAGTFTFSSATLSIGTHSLVATYAGDANNSPESSNIVTVVVQQASTITTLVSSLNPATLGQNVTFTATVTSSSPSITGAVSFMDGGNSLGSVAVVNGVATYSTTMLAFGQHTITAVYGGDTNHATSTSSVVNESIVQPATAAIISSANPSVTGNSVVFTAKVSGVGSLVPTGKVTFSDGASALAVGDVDATGTATYTTSALTIGSHIMGLTYGGDSNYSKANASVIQTITGADTNIGLTASANPAVYGSPVTFTAKVASNGGAATGVVTFNDDGTAIGTGTLDANGVATFTTTKLKAGTQSIVATYAGDGKASTSSSVPLSLVVQQVTKVAVLSSANPSLTLSAITFTATITNAGASVPTGTVSFVDGTTNLGTANVDATGHATVSVTSMIAGNHSVVASYTGDGADFASVSAALAQGVTLRPTTTALSSTSTDPNNPLTVTLIGVVHWSGNAAPPSGKVTFKTSSNTIGSAIIDATGVATITMTLQTQTESIVASYNGDDSYASSDSLATNITGGAATQFTMVLDPPNASLQSKQRTTVNLTLSSIKGFTDMMQFGCLGLPYAATCTFSKPQGTLPADGTMTVQVVVDTGDPLGSGAQATASNRTPSNIVLAFLPLGLLAGFALRRRKRILPGLLLLLIGIAATAGMTGCAGLQSTGTPAGTYSFKVTASGQGTGATKAAVMNLTVKQ